VTVSSKYEEGSVFSAVLPQGIVENEPLAQVENPAEKAVLCYERHQADADSIIRTMDNLGVKITVKTDEEEFFRELADRDYPFVFVTVDIAVKADEMIKMQSSAATLVQFVRAGEIVPLRNMPMVTKPAYAVPVANVLNHRIAESRKWQGGQFIAPDAHILVVDDINTNLVVTAGLLAIYRSHVDTCTNGAEAIRMVRERHYDIVFMDHMMPEMDGIEATRNIRILKGYYYQNLPIIALTANAIIGMKEMFLSHGFNDYLSKPIEVSKLDNILASWLPREKQVKKTFPDELQTDDAVISEDSPVEGINIQAGKVRYQEKIYLQVLRAYCLHTPVLLEKLYRLRKEPFSEKGMDDYIITIHGLKGSTYGICADETAKLAEALEKAARERNIQFIEANNGAFMETIEKLLKGLKDFLAGTVDASEVKPSAAKPDPALLEKLADACKHYKATAMEEILESIEAFQYESGNDLIEWLREQTDNLEYDLIQRRLETELESR
jgi:CheY-like chemotaxis protein